MGLEMTGGDVEIQVGPVKLTLRPSKPEPLIGNLAARAVAGRAAVQKATELHDHLDSLEADLEHAAGGFDATALLGRVRRIRAILREMGDDSG